MTKRRITDSFSLFGTKKVSDAEKRKAVAQVRRAITTPLVRERLMLAEMYGYFEKKALTDDPDNPPAFRTVKISISDDGIVTHTEELFDTATGDDVDAMQHSGVGGWSWASTDGSGKPDWRYFSGFIYKCYPNVSATIGRTVSFFESAPELVQGKDSVVTTGMGDKVRTAFVVVDIRDLIISNSPDGTINPYFPAELQPRDRTSLKSKLQALDISRSLDLNRLSDSAGDGAPIIGPDNVVESGNGRAMGILRAYTSGTADHYRESLIASAESFGLSQSVVERFESPVLVRIRLDDIDRAQFAIDANIPMVSGSKAEKGTAAMMEAARDKKKDAARRALIADAKNMKDMIATVKIISGPSQDFSMSEAYGRLVGSWMRDLQNRYMTKEQYVSKVQALLGKTYSQFMKKVPRPAQFATAVQQRIPRCSVSALVLKTVIVAVVLNGEGWGVRQAWGRWIMDRGYDGKIAMDAAKEMMAQTRPLMKKNTRTGSYNFIEGCWSWLVSIGLDADAFIDDKWAWWDLAHKFVAVNFPDADTAKQNYKDMRQRGIKALPDFHKTVDATLEKIRNFHDDNPKLVDELERRGDLTFSQEAHLKRIFQTNDFSPTPYGRDGLRSMMASLPASFTAALREATSGCNYLVLSAQQALKGHHGIDEAKGEELTNGLEIDPKLEELHGHFMGEGRLREWIAECFQLLGGRPQSLEKFELVPDKGDGRAFASSVDRTVCISYKDSKKTVWHEIGHHYEYSTTGALEAAQVFLLAKRHNADPITLNKYANAGHKDSEVCIQDGLFQPYAGKIYSPNNTVEKINSSEVFSVGVEYLSGDGNGAFSVANMDGLMEYVFAFIKENPVG